MKWLEFFGLIPKKAIVAILTAKKKLLKHLSTPLPTNTIKDPVVWQLVPSPILSRCHSTAYFSGLPSVSPAVSPVLPAARILPNAVCIPP